MMLHHPSIPYLPIFKEVCPRMSEPFLQSMHSSHCMSYAGYPIPLLNNQWISLPPQGIVSRVSGVKNSLQGERDPLFGER